jgi:hypothetical protein
MVEIAKVGRALAHTPEAQARRAKAQGRHANARQGWVASSLPTWLNNEAYLERIQPALAGITCSAIASALGVSVPYAASIRSGRRIPHPRHWERLAGVVEIGLNEAGLEGSSFEAIRDGRRVRRKTLQRLLAGMGM